MPLQKLKFRPGISQEQTTLAGEGGWYACDKIRFRTGMPEKLGGWVKDSGTTTSTLQPPTGAYWGIARSLWNWITLTGRNLLSVGTHLKYYIQDSQNGGFNDITPIRTTTSAGAITFAATTGSPTLVVTCLGHGAQTGDFVTFSGAVSLGGAMTAAVLNAEFQITYLSGNTFSVTASVNATVGDVGNGGAATVGAFQLTSGASFYTLGVGWGAGVWGGLTPGATTTTLNGAINNSVASIVLTSATGFPASGTVLIDLELISYTGISTNTLTGCSRGVSGTTAASHSSGALVQAAASFIGWGTAATAYGVGSQLRIWSESNYGENLIFNPRGGALYYWAVNANPNIYDRGARLASTSSGIYQTDTSCPSVCNFVMVSDSSRFVIALGCNDYGSTVLDPMLVRWSAQEDYRIWAPAVTNQAGSYRLSHGSLIIGAQQTRQEILIWTDASLYSMQYLGPPYVWGFQLLADNISLAGPKAMITSNSITYWMGLDKFYMYSGRTEVLRCDLWQHVFGDINTSQSFQFFAGSVERYQEVWWFYCSANSTSIDRYVVFNYADNIWFYGTLARTAWLDSSLRDNPIAAAYNSRIVYHELGVDDALSDPPAAISAYVQSSDFDLGDGHNFSLVSRLLPDITFDGSTSAAPAVTFTALPRDAAGTGYGSSNNPSVVSGNSYITQRTYDVQRFTPIVYVRIRGRQMAFKISSSTIGTQWQLGVPRIDIRPDGRR